MTAPEGIEALTANDKLAHASSRSIDQPAPTVTAGHDHQNRKWLPLGRVASVREVAALQSYPTHIERGAPLPIIALDDFAGTGWGVACLQLGIEEYGVELMPEARATREANGMRTLYADIWDGLLGWEQTPTHDLYIASPPCQTFSMAGSGKGREALDEVLEVIERGDWKDPLTLHDLTHKTDPKTALVLTPLARVWMNRPRLVVFEQVPPVLPVWKACAEQMRAMGYSVWVGYLNAEQYGVPQTRKRAILIARNDGIEATPPPPTHSKFYPTDPKRLDPDVLPWVPMAQALGWGMTERPYLSIAAGAATEDNRHTGGTDTSMTGGSAARARIAAEQERGAWALRSQSQTGHGERAGEPGERTEEEPAFTVTSKAQSDQWEPRRFVSAQSLSGGERATRDEDEPAVTMTSSQRSARWEHGATGEPMNLDPDKPATTVAGDPRLSAREHHYHGEQNATSTKVTVGEASALQSYPPEFDWEPLVPNPRGKGAPKPLAKTKAFLQIGNAVPPLLARAILAHLIAPVWPE